ncbi:hypothetical protein [Halolamina sp.]|uniref:hypothetical protein n=1 Tax=Halolamina sp. TaxID=1940283 RepID=UPI003567F5F1
MMSESLFTGMLVLFWVAEAAFGGLVAYWFITQGFDSDKDTASGAQIELEDRSETLQSLAMWGGFFGLLLLGIIVGT